MACTKLPILGYYGYGFDSTEWTLCRLPSSTPGTVGMANEEVTKQLTTISDADGYGWLKNLYRTGQTYTMSLLSAAGTI